MSIEVRTARSVDAKRMGSLHAARIEEGFLASLGERFLARLYRRVVMSPDAFGAVAVDERGEVVGFVATALDVSALYRRFIVRDGVAAGIAAAPKLVRSWRRVLETLRYPSHASSLPAPEVLSVAVDTSAAGRGVGRALLASAQRELERREVQAVKVVAGSHNTAAMALYRSAGFREVETIEVHAGVQSTVLVWDAPKLHVVHERSAK